MTPIKDYIAEGFVGNTYHFKCDCLMPLDFIGVVRGYRISNEEIIFQIEEAEKKKLIEIGINHPKMMIEKR